MSNITLVKSMQKPRSLTEGNRFITPVMLSDSKGEYIKTQVLHHEDRNIVWWCKKGDTIEKRLRWLGTNISDKINRLRNIHLYVWLGTCDITSKTSDGTISLRSQHREAPSRVTENLEKFIDALKPYPNCKITFLEVPYYSIATWNKKFKPTKTEQYAEQDSQLIEQIDKINTHIYQLNATLQKQYPLLNIHLLARKQVRRGKSAPNKEYINFKLLIDGIYPKPILAKVWLAKISQQIRKDCWH